MIRRLRYVNSKGDEIEFGGSSGPWHYGRTDIFDIKLEHRSVGGRVTGFRAGIREMSLAVFMLGGSASERDRFVDVVSYDTAVGEAGTLYAGASRMRCWIPSAQMSEYGHYDSMAIYDCAVLSDRPAWIREARRTLVPASGLTIGGLDHPHDYPHDYLYSGGASVELANPFQSPATVDIAFPGPCVSPYVIIGANRYQVDESVSRGQLLIVRGTGADRDIVVRSSDGGERSVFGKGLRRPGAHIFAKIPVGRHVASWSGPYNIELTLCEERTSPAWQTD